jgi:hypothetical protein
MLRKIIETSKIDLHEISIELAEVFDEIDEKQRKIAEKKKELKRNGKMEQEQQSTDSLYDFLYVDNQRASSLLAQMNGPGVVTSIKHVTAEIDKSMSDQGLTLKLSSPK